MRGCGRRVCVCLCVPAWQVACDYRFSLHLECVLFAFVFPSVCVPVRAHGGSISFCILNVRARVRQLVCAFARASFACSLARGLVQMFSFWL